jgi:hypothetical protein
MLLRTRLIPVLAVLALAVPAAAATHPWQTIGLPRLTVTEGVLTSPDNGLLETHSGALRATVRDGGRHAAWARLSFRLLGASTEVKPLGSGLVRRQIGLKLRAQDPCNLVYVMWRSAPDAAIAIFVKSNPGQATSAECGNRGYTDVATIPAPQTAIGQSHVLQARTKRTADGGLAVSVFIDGALLRRQVIGPELVAGLEGPVGVRSDNGAYEFRLGVHRP